MSNFSVKKPFTIFVMVIIIIILGFMSFSKMRADLLPSINLPYMIVSTTYAGASPEKIEKTVTVPLEKYLATTTNVKNVTSISSENVSIVMLEFTDNTNMDSALIEINNKINVVKGAWNDNKIGTPTVTKINPNMLPVMIAAVNMNDMELSELSDFVNDNIVNEIQKISGVASVTPTGVLEEKINVALNQDKIDSLNDKVFAKIDKELAKTESDLINAKNEISKGRETLNSTKAEQTEQITSGIEQLNSGKEQLSNAIASLEQKEGELNYLSNTLSLVLTFINKGDDDAAIKTVRENLPEVNTIGVKLKEEIEDRLAQVKAGLNEITIAKNELYTQKISLEFQQRELENAKNTLNSEISKAYDQLNSSEEQVNQGLNELSTAKDKAYKNASLDGIITQSMISGILTAENFSMPAGYINTDDDKIAIKVGDEFNSLDEIQKLKLMNIDVDGIGDVLLEDVADISIKNNADELYAKINGNDSVLLSIQKQSTESTGEVSDNIKEKFSQLEKQYEGLEFTALMDQGIYIDLVISSVLENLLYGAILAIFVLLIFLRDVKPTIAIAISIPISLTLAISLMYFTGVSINVISLSGLALSVGMLVDNSIVVIENIYRLKNEGLPIKDAAIKGASTVAGAIFASTLTTICVFFPIVFVEGMTRDLFTDMALTIAYALLASLLIALTVIPALTSKLFSKKGQIQKKKHAKSLKIYDSIVRLALNHKAITLVSAFVLFLGSIALVANMGTAFIPEIEGTQMSLTVNFDNETSQGEGNEIANEVVDRLLEIDDIKTVGALRSTGAMSAMSGGSNSVSMYIILDKNRQLSNADMEKTIYEKTSDLNCELNVQTSNMDMSALGGSGVEIIIKGNDLYKLQNIARDVESILMDVEGVTNIDNGIGEAVEELKVTIDKNKAIDYGLTVAEIYSTIAEKSTIDNQATIVNVENKEYPVVVVKTEKDFLTEDKLGQLEFSNKQDEEDKVELSEISSIERKDGTLSINRENSERYISVTAEIDADHNIGLVSRDIDKVLKDYEVPNGYSIETSGENETINQALGDLGLMVLVAVAFIYLIMVAQFQSLKLPFIIMFTIPLAFTGGLLALVITGKELSVISMIGFLILAGIIVNNGIVLIDYINQLRASGKNKYDAIVEAGRTRLRPILMTALTTILGMSTMALGFGMGSDMIQPLGIVVIGGMIYATILTLVVVPCMYAIVVREKVGDNV